MIRTIITPDNKTVSIELPEDYVGKQVEILLYKTDELNEQKPQKKANAARFRGALKLTEEEYKDFQQHAKDIRTEWD